MRKTLFVLFLLTALVPIIGTAQTGADPVPPGVNWLSEVTDQVNALVTNYGDQLVALGTTELTFFAIFTLVGIVVRWQISHMVIGFRPVNYTIGDLLAFFINLAACSLLLHYYNAPLPGAGISIHQVFPAFAKAVTNILDQSLIDGFLDRVREAAAGTQAPSAFNLTGAIVYATVLFNVAFMDLIMFAVNAFGFIALGLFTLFGPLLIPLFITRSFKHKFWHWVDGLLVFSMFRAVSAAISFIYLNVMIGFFDNTVAGDYSLGHWLALIPTLILLNGGLLWSMFQVPRITGMIFGGVSGQAQAFVDNVTSTIVALATTALILAMTHNVTSTLISDFAGAEIYSTHFHERRILRSTVLVLAAVSLVLAGSVVHLATRPVIYRYIRIDEAGRATPITYNDLDYSPREAEIRTFLTDWATFRYSMLRNSIAKTYPRNYYFLEDALAAKLMQLDTKDATLAKVVTGGQEEHDAQINNVTFTALGREQIGRTSIYSGAALIDLFKIFNSYPQRREHWTVSVTFYLNPDEISKKSVRFPQFEVINPLGLIITDLHEARAAV